MKKQQFLILFAFLGLGFLSLSLSTSNKVFSDKTDPDNCLDDLEVPKRFTPNGDGIDDVFTIKFPCPPESCEIQLFDAAETEVFITKKHIFEWNGLNKEQRPCDSGIYSWKLRYMYHMNYVERKGQVLLLR